MNGPRRKTAAETLFSLAERPPYRPPYSGLCEAGRANVVGRSRGWAKSCVMLASLFLSTFAGTFNFSFKVPAHGESSCGVQGDVLRDPIRAKMRVRDCANYDTTYTLNCMPGDSLAPSITAPDGHAYRVTVWLENHIGRCCGFLEHTFVLPAVNVPVPPPPDTTSVGIVAKYFPNITRSAPAFMIRTEGPIDHLWALGPPSPGGPVDQWSYEAVGTITIPTTGSYTFYVKADDGPMLIVNGTMGINKWGTQPLTEWTYTVSLTAGVKSFGLYYMAGVGNSELHLSWSGPNIPKQLIPRSALR